ncbi:L antigen family member 3, partial [Stegodyphus mimosarum]
MNVNNADQRGFVTHMEVPFQTFKEATIAYNSLRIDAEPLRGGVIKELTVRDNYVIVRISSKDLRKLRSAVSSFLDFLILVTNTIAKFGETRKDGYHTK